MENKKDQIGLLRNEEGMVTGIISATLSRDSHPVMDFTRVANIEDLFNRVSQAVTLPGNWQEVKRAQKAVERGLLEEVEVPTPKWGQTIVDFEEYLKIQELVKNIHRVFWTSYDPNDYRSDETKMFLLLSQMQEEEGITDLVIKDQYVRVLFRKEEEGEVFRCSLRLVPFTDMYSSVSEEHINQAEWLGCWNLERAKFFYEFCLKFQESAYLERKLQDEQREEEDLLEFVEYLRKK